MLTRFQIGKNSVKYDRKFLQTDAYKKAITAQRPVISEFGTKGQKVDPTKSLLTRFIPSIVSLAQIILIKYCLILRHLIDLLFLLTLSSRFRIIRT